MTRGQSTRRCVSIHKTENSGALTAESLEPGLSLRRSLDEIDAQRTLVVDPEYIDAPDPDDIDPPDPKDIEPPDPEDVEPPEPEDVDPEGDPEPPDEPDPDDF